MRVLFLPAPVHFAAEPPVLAGVVDVPLRDVPDAFTAGIEPVELARGVLHPGGYREAWKRVGTVRLGFRDDRRDDPALGDELLPAYSFVGVVVA